LRAVTGGLVLLTAALRRVEARCEHVPWPPRFDASRALVSCSARAAVCERPECMATLRRRWHDDQRCELCERPAAGFTPYTAPLGPLLVTVELCGDCAPLIATPTRGDADA
jgi:hypothetical protein